MNGLRELIEEILDLISKKGKVRIKEIQDTLSLTEETTNMSIDLLVKFGFAKLDQNKGYITLSAPCKKFFERTKDKNLLLQ